MSWIEWTILGLALLWTWGMLGRLYNILKEIQKTLENQKK